ncbi:MAG TPA: plasmid replication protein, CyRepA1 family, partial [Candidatus Competibacteraceae bacterium]|nr:plasmid replication protein, CyRepA1 family [Candidatus Competibacteraceae bacterium]
MHDIQALQSALANDGLGQPELILDGQIHRFATPDKPGKRNGWYCGHVLPSGALTCTYGAYHRDFKRTFTSWTAGGAAPTRAQIEAEMATAQRHAQKRQQQQHAVAASKTARFWNEAREHGISPYLDRKQVGAFGIRFLGETVVIPLHLANGELCGLQFIDADGRKRFLKGSRKQGAFHVIGTLRNGEPIGEAEGYATAASIHQATGMAVVVAFDAGNLAAVAAQLRRLYPNSELILCADNDAWTDGNPGWSKAEAAALQSGGKLAVPCFVGLDVSTKPTDFNDLQHLAGREAVRQQIERAARPTPITLAPKPNLEQDLKRLAITGPGQALELAREIVRRHVAMIPRQMDAGDLARRLAQHFNGSRRELANVHTYLEQRLAALKRQARADTTLDLAELRRRPNLHYEAITTLEGVAARLVEDYQAGQPAIVLLKAPIASGKTSTVLAPLAWHSALHPEVKLGLVHRQSLAADLAHRCGLTNYQHVSTPAMLEATRELALCINSLCNPKYQRFIGQSRVILIDEIGQVLREVWSPNGTIAGHARHGGAQPRTVWNTLVTLLQGAAIVVGADADLNTATVTALAEALPERDIQVLELTTVDTDLTVEYGDRRQAWQRLLAALNAQQKVLIGTDSAKEVQRLELTLRQYYPDRRILAVHSQAGTATTGADAVQALLANINTAAPAYDVLIYSPAIASGVSLEVAHFDLHIFLYHAAVIPADFVQMMRRDRTARRFFLGFCGPCRDQAETDPAVILAHLDASHKRTVILASDEAGCTIRLMPQSSYDRHVVANLAREATARNHAGAHLLHLLEARGYRLVRSIEATVESTVLQTARQSQTENYNQALLQAEPITLEEREGFRHQTTPLTPEASAAVAAYDARQVLALAELDAAALDHWDQGRLAPKVRRYRLLREPLAALADDLADEEASAALSNRRNRLALAEALRHTVEVMGFDPATGTGELTEATALDTFKSLQSSTTRPVLEVQHLISFRQPPAYPVRWCSRLLAKLGLKLTCIRQTGSDGHRQRCYAIAVESWYIMEEIYQRHRQRPAERTDSVLNTLQTTGVRAA